MAMEKSENQGDEGGATKGEGEGATKSDDKDETEGDVEGANESDGEGANESDGKAEGAIAWGWLCDVMFDLSWTTVRGCRRDVKTKRLNRP